MLMVMAVTVIAFPVVALLARPKPLNVTSSMLALTIAFCVLGSCNLPPKLNLRFRFH